MVSNKFNEIVFEHCDFLLTSFQNKVRLKYPIFFSSFTEKSFYKTNIIITEAFAKDFVYFRTSWMIQTLFNNQLFMFNFV